MCGECCGEVGKGHKHGHERRRDLVRKCCCCGQSGWRKFKTKQEKIDELKEYREELQKELQAIEEKIEHL